MESEQTGFWDNPKRAGSAMKELERLKGEREKFSALEKDIDDTADLIALGLSDSETTEIEHSIASFEKTFAEWEFWLCFRERMIRTMSF